MNSLAIIPARGGSKGIPRKNVCSLAGKPLIAHIIECALQSEKITRVIVSTDDPEIAAVSRQYGAEVVWRPAEISGDTASSEVALLHVLEHLKTTENYQPDLIVFLQCTSPLTAPEDIDGTVQVLLDEGADSAFTVTPFHYFLWNKNQSGEAVGINHDKRVRSMRQEREPQYVETGAVYAMRTEGFLRAKHRFFGKTVMHITPPERRWEIDEPIDFRVAEVLMQEQRRRQNLQALPSPISGLVMDFDGVFTDNRVIVFQDGREAVLCDRGDGLGLDRLKQLGLPLLVLSTEKNSVVQARCEKLGIPCQQGVSNKIGALKEWLKKNNLNPSEVIYVGNDINDLPCLQYVGCSVAVGDAYPEVKASSRLTLSAHGGKGAIRELAELLIQRLKEDKTCQTQLKSADDL